MPMVPALQLAGSAVMERAMMLPLQDCNQGGPAV